jgi:Helix-turn-helix domain
MEVKDHMPLAELKGLEGVEKDADRARRLRIVILAVEGWPAIAMAVGLTRRICQRRARRYNEEGLAGLDDRRGHEPHFLGQAAWRISIDGRPEAVPSRVILGDGLFSRENNNRRAGPRGPLKNCRNCDICK